MIREGTIGELMPDLWRKNKFSVCLYCGKKIEPGLMNQAEHWVECPKNPTVLKALETKSPLIEHVKQIIQI